ncbi:MAG: hypothetical protein EXR75_09965 [Myxococcales bacterium]|nr:hypothetical protein [Myxococcales bacterium]
MIPSPDLSTLPETARQLLSAGTDARLRTMAARGIMLGLRPDQVVTVLTLLARDADPAIAALADQTLTTLPGPLLHGALAANLQPFVIDALVLRYGHESETLAQLLVMPACDWETACLVATSGNERATEIVATNQERLLAHPELIAALYMNRATRMSTCDRIVELAARHGIRVDGIPAWQEAARAVENELIAEPSDEALPEDLAFYEQQALADGLSGGAGDDTFFEDGDGTEQITDKFKPLYQRIAEMSVSQKVRRAILGTKEERMMLIREQNKIVATAAARSPLLKESEVAQVARNRGISEEVLRIIAGTSEWLKSYQIKINLVQNAKTPITIAVSLVPLLREADLKRLTTDKNVSSAVQMAAKRHLERRKH